MRKFFNILHAEATRLFALVGPYASETEAFNTLKATQNELASQGISITTVSNTSGLFQTVGIGGARSYAKKDIDMAIKHVLAEPANDERCPRCTSPRLVEDDEEFSCVDCGHIFAKQEAL